MVSIIAFTQAPKLGRICNDIVEGEPLPPVVHSFFFVYKYLWIAPTFIIVLTLIFYWSKAVSIKCLGVLALISTIVFLALQAFLSIAFFDLVDYFVRGFGL